MQAISTQKVFSSQAISQAGVVLSAPIDLREIDVDGDFSLFYGTTGAGTVKLEYVLSPEKDGIYIEPTGASDIVAAATGSGRAAFTPEVAPWMKIRATENNVGAITALDVWVNVR
jgi:hypothetical protein